MTAHRWLWACCLVGCSGASVTAGERPKTEAYPAADYSVTQKSASQPERAEQKLEVKSEPLAPARASDQGCAATECEGDLSATARAQLQATAAKTQTCYELELKDNPQLEGRWSVLLRLLSSPSAVGNSCPLTIERAGFQASEAFRRCLNDVFGTTQAQATNGCVDVALPLSFVRQEVEVPAPAAGGATATGSSTAGTKTSR